MNKRTKQRRKLHLNKSLIITLQKTYINFRQIFLRVIERIKQFK